MEPSAAARGRFELDLGPMFSGKTTEMASKIERARLGHLSCVIVKHSDDTRNGGGPVIKTHGGVSLRESAATDEKGALRIVVAEELAPLGLGADELVVGVDEGQFFPDLPEAVDRWMREGRRVYVAALDGDFRRRPFGRVHEALPLATAVRKLPAVCMVCRQTPPADAHYTIRTVDETAVKLIGAAEAYKAACLACFIEHGGGASPASAEEP